MEISNIRKISMPLHTTVKNARNENVLKTEKQKRVITALQRWQFTEEQLAAENQIEYIRQIHENNIKPENENICKTIKQQIQQKLYGYKSQDMLKNLYLPEKIMDMERTIEKIKECENRCYYCTKNIIVLYEFVRDPKQWTLERIDNKHGHNIDNSVIACLNCNLSRRTMYHERYLFTKQISITKTT